MNRGGGYLAGLMLCVGTAAVAADEEPICADRPGKANPTCTVPVGNVQLETGLADRTHDRSAGVTTDELDFGGTAVKFGLTDRMHLELDLPTYSNIRTQASGLHDRVSGFGDSGVALKYRVTKDSAPVQVALYPFVKIPTARHALGNGKVEGGTALLVDGTIGGSSVGFDFAPEVDVTADADGHGYHIGMVQVASLGVPLSSRFSLSGDLWGAWDFDPAGTTRQFSIDGAAALLLSDNVQVDAGANFGLNRNTPDIEIYTGVAVRF